MLSLWLIWHWYSNWIDQIPRWKLMAHSTRCDLLTSALLMMLFDDNEIKMARNPEKIVKKSQIGCNGWSKTWKGNTREAGAQIQIVLGGGKCPPNPLLNKIQSMFRPPLHPPPSLWHHSVHFDSHKFTVSVAPPRSRCIKSCENEEVIS